MRLSKKGGISTSKFSILIRLTIQGPRTLLIQLSKPIRISFRIKIEGFFSEFITRQKEESSTNKRSKKNSLKIQKSRSIWSVGNSFWKQRKKRRIYFSRKRWERDTDRGLSRHSDSSSNSERLLRINGKLAEKKESKNGEISRSQI